MFGEPRCRFCLNNSTRGGDSFSDGHLGLFRFDGISFGMTPNVRELYLDPPRGAKGKDAIKQPLRV